MAYKLMKVQSKVLKNGVHYLSSDYKTRNLKRRSHSGIDMIGKGYACDYIVAIEKGVVITASYNALKGYYVEINHGLLTSVYYHLKKNTTAVKVGDNVVKGQVIGYMGTTGYSSGNHLHFGILKNGIVIDPLPYLEGTPIEVINNGDISTYNKFNLTKLLKYGSKGNDVKELQKELNKSGWRDAKLRKLTEDGIFGNNTLVALKKMQKKRKLIADGIVGKNTAHSMGWLYKGE